MSTPDEDEEIEHVPLPPLPMDPGTVEWLRMISGGSDAEAARIIASMLRDIRVDDEKAHATIH